MASNQPATEKLLLTVSEAAAMLGVSRSHLYTQLDQGLLPTITLGRSRRIPALWLRRWVDAQVAEWEQGRADGPQA